jgi:hypothetical protein
MRIYCNFALAGCSASALTEADHAAAHAVVTARRLGDVAGCKSAREEGAQNEIARGWLRRSINMEQTGNVKR